MALSRTAMFSAALRPEPVRPTAIDEAHAAVSRIYGELGDQIQKLPTDVEADRVAGRIVAQLPELARAGDVHGLALAEIALRALAASPPRPELARELAERLSAAGSGRSPALRVMFGLGGFLYVAIGAVFALRSIALPDQVAGIPTTELMLAGLLGAIGSIASMMLRLHQFEDLRFGDRLLPLVIGIVRPIIGISFGVFCYLAMSSEVISVGVPNPDRRIFLMLTVAFVAGFSERFVPDLVQRVADRALAPGETPRR